MCFRTWNTVPALEHPWPWEGEWGHWCPQVKFHAPLTPQPVQQGEERRKQCDSVESCFRFHKKLDSDGNLRKWKFKMLRHGFLVAAVLPRRIQTWRGEEVLCPLGLCRAHCMVKLCCCFVVQGRIYSSPGHSPQVCGSSLLNLGNPISTGYEEELHTYPSQDCTSVLEGALSLWKCIMEGRVSFSLCLMLCPYCGAWGWNKAVKSSLCC